MNELIKNTEARMEKSIDALTREFATVRAGRANAAVLDKITVDYYGTATPIQQIATISVPEARTLQIQPWDTTTLKLIEKAIQVSDIGINPNNDGRVIRLIFPPLTEERRKELVKDVKKMAEDSKVAIRSIRRDSIEKLKAMKKAGDITEDDQQNGEKKIQNVTDKYCSEVDSLQAAKEKEILEI